MATGRLNIILIIVFSLSMVLTSCEKFEGDQTVPSYLQIDTIYLGDNPDIEEGFLTHNFTDIWVYVNDQMIGAYELPAIIPVLEQGINKLSLYAGIKYNGMSGTRGEYLFTQPRTSLEFEFYMDSIVKRNPTVFYYNTAEFTWMEDFEGSNISLKETSNSDTTIHMNNYGEGHPLYGVSGGVAYLDSENQIFEVTTFLQEEPGFDFPAGGQPVFLEIDYNTNNFIVIGIFVTRIGSGITQHPVVVFNSTGGVWKKAYVNLSPSVTAYNTSDHYNVYIRAEKEPEVDLPVILLDNLKLLNRNAF